MSEGIKWAIENEEDVILFVLNPLNQLPTYALIEKSIQIAVDSNIHLLYIQNHHTDGIRFSSHFLMENNLIDVDAFLITKGLFHYIIHILEELDQDIDSDLLSKILKLVCPYNFVLNPEQDFIQAENNIVLITPFRNAGNYLQECVDSVAQQNYGNYKHILLDDDSDDGGLESIKETEKLIAKKNTIRKYAIRNIADELLNTDFGDDDIICFLDGDDALAHNYVLAIINGVYHQYNCALTYGGMSIMNANGVVSDKYSSSEFLRLREVTWKAFHFRTFKYHLFKEVIHQDPHLSFLKDEENNFLKMPYDMAILFPLMEISGYQKSKHISASLYKYRLHSQNDHILSESEQSKGERIIRNKASFPITNHNDI
ncbi:glycosyltransferase [Sphingobacterium ginsenosidimutans]|uniref:glycosyltransferase n=1 Tax=Sphingobacterium ginsenosidimutans TaxID=687845 RepID=UPI0031F84800